MTTATRRPRPPSAAAGRGVLAVLPTRPVLPVLAVLAAAACSPADAPTRSARAKEGAALPAPAPAAAPRPERERAASPAPSLPAPSLFTPERTAPTEVAALSPGLSPAFAPPPPPFSGGEDDGLTEASARPGREAVAVLQIGDSHTAADYFTGEVRRILQARYGDGGPGYLEVGRPHPGVRKADLDVRADPGWSYQSIQGVQSGQAAAQANQGSPNPPGPPNDASQFALSGFLARTSQAGQSLSFVAAAPRPYTDIDVEAQVGPGQGGIDVSVDGRLARHVELAAPEAGRTVVHVAAPGRRGLFHRIDIRSTGSTAGPGPGPVAVLSVDARDRGRGLTYSNIGFPGATVDIVNRFPAATVTEALRRLRPRVVVLAFGTNEGFNDRLDLARYRERYEAVIALIRAGAPDAALVMVGPALANRLPPDCRREPAGGACRAALDAARAGAGDEAACPWPTPPQLGRVRDVQREIASAGGIAFWDWSTIMPKHCGAEAWVTASPRLMTPDHVHFTPDGYRRGGQAFASFIDPIIIRTQQGFHAVSNR